MATVILVRHGRTTANASGTLAGRLPGVRLDETGVAQAGRTAERLAAVPLAGVVTSPLERCRQRGGRVVAVGTTTVRTLESWARSGQTTGETDIFITPGFDFRVVDLLVTNFHLPKSTLMMLVSAFAGYDQVMALYQHAIAQEYRFFSYGDAMLLSRCGL